MIAYFYFTRLLMPVVLSLHISYLRKSIFGIIFLLTMFLLIFPTFHVVSITKGFAEDNNTLRNMTFSIIQISDTQFLTESYPSLFNGLTNWIAANAAIYNLAMVVHTGDIVYVGNSDEQWQVANTAMSTLLINNLPYIWVAGNHDQDLTDSLGTGNPDGDWIGQNYQAFNSSYLQNKPYWVSSICQGKNTAAQFTIGTYRFLVIGLEYHANSTAMAWLTDLISTYSDYNIIVATDDTYKVYEGTNENNNSSQAMPIVLTQQTPELQVTQIDAPATAASGGNFAISWIVKNFGTGWTNSNYWYDEVYLSSDQAISSNDISLGKIQHSGTLGASDQYTAQQTFKLSAELSGNYYVLVRTDSTNVIYEDPLDNNNDRESTGTTSISLTAMPDLTVENINAPEEGISGQWMQVSWTVKNSGSNTGNNSESWTLRAYRKNRFAPIGTRRF